ncbi:hypothetical protein [Salinimonas iocasae]|uniref:Uncharacterized protein n=1 Tax=Salinimonas iocasae TaxID=2572577 RepID=A0A5B7YAZ3_9ALTE|nr:hypothetical protein [Salinimonas iocasae]QCZ92794.1 hypothetical protein FBQ74_04555 [Salinimonas iocasae]
MNRLASAAGCPDKKIANASGMMRKWCQGQEAPYTAVLFSRIGWCCLLAKGSAGSAEGVASRLLLAGRQHGRGC